MTTWVPPDISKLCSGQNGNLTQCSDTAILFLSLLVHLFDNSIDNEIAKSDNKKLTENPSVNLKVQTSKQTNFNLSDESPTIDYKEETNKESNDKGDNKNKKTISQEEYDFIVVGAGSAGCVVANRLSEVKEWKVLLLEAGPEEPDVTSVPAFANALVGSNIDWNYKTQPEELTCKAQKDQVCHWVRGKTMGGSSAVNYMIYMRGNKRDYDEWAEMGNCGWSYKEVLPYFKKSENNQNMDIVDQKYHGYKGPLNVELFPFIDENNVMLIEALLEKGLPLTDFNGKKQIGANLAQSTSKDGKRMSVNVAYIRPIRNERPNLKIITDAFATNVLINRITKTAFGVQYIKNNRYHKVYARKEVIVSCGSLNSPKLLMLSGIGPRKHLERLNIPVISDLKVGHNLQDHVCTNALVIGLSNKTSTLVTEQELVDEIYEYHSQKGRKTGPLSATGPISAAAFLNVKSFSGVPNIQLSFDGRNVKEFYSDPTTYTATDILPLSFYNGLSARTILLTPKSRGLVELNETDPIFGPPVIYPKFFTAKEDLDTLVAALNYVVSLEQTEIFKANGASFIKQPLEACSDHEWGSENYFKCLFTHYTGTIFHPVGTCKMGPAWDEEAVVDPRLRVYGVKYLRVIDASVMCKIIRGNTNAPTIMTAEKACDLIKEEHLIC